MARRRLSKLRAAERNLDCSTMNTVGGRVAEPKVGPEAQRLVMDVTTQLVTLSLAAIGVISGFMFTTFEGTPYIASALMSLFSFLLCVLFAVLAQLAVVAEAIRDRKLLKINYPLALLFGAWVWFVLAITAFVVFTWANINLSR
jgi:hypothetical protein